MFSQALQHQMSLKYQRHIQVYPASQFFLWIPGVLKIPRLVLSLIFADWKKKKKSALWSSAGKKYQSVRERNSTHSSH